MIGLGAIKIDPNLCMLGMLGYIGRTLLLSVIVLPHIIALSTSPPLKSSLTTVFQPLHPYFEGYLLNKSSATHPALLVKFFPFNWYSHCFCDSEY